MNLIVTWEKLAIGHINGKCNLTPMTTNKQIKLSFLYPPVKFKESNVPKCPYQKHLGIVLDSKINFDTRIDQKIKKCNKLMGDHEKALGKSSTKCLTYNLQIFYQVTS